MSAPRRKQFTHEERLGRLWELTPLLGAETDPRRLVSAVLDQAIELVAAERGFVVLCGPGTNLDIAAARNIDREEVLHPEFKISRSIVNAVATSGTPELIADAATDEKTREQESIQALNLRSVLCVPLRAHGRTIGVLYVDHRFATGSFDASDLRTLEVFAVPAAIALDAARRTHELERGQAELSRRIDTIERLRAEIAERARERAREVNRLRGQIVESAPTTEAHDVPGVVARSGAMRRLLDVVRKVAPSTASVLVLGESGSGKEVLARAIHRLSPRRDAPFLAENCAALAESLLESELFGHEPGAFTGAARTHIGLFEAARGGTLFLDEIGDTSPGLQAKLLRVIQEREIRRLGGEERIPIDVRVVAATHRDLDALVARGEFRADLFYRLNVVRLEIPPLRDRPEDTAALVRHLLASGRVASPTPGRPVAVEPQALELLLAHDWPGNIRELENELQRAALLAGADAVIRPLHLSPAIRGGFAAPAKAALDAAPGVEPTIEGVWLLETVEKEMIERALRRTQGNKTFAARLLGIPKTSLYHKLEKHGILADKPPRGATPHPPQ